MALFLLYANAANERNASGLDAVLVDAASEAAARTAAQARTPNGETKVPATWAAVSLAATATMPDSRVVIWLEGPAASLVGKMRNGDNLGIQ